MRTRGDRLKRPSAAAASNARPTARKASASSRTRTASTPAKTAVKGRRAQSASTTSVSTARRTSARRTSSASMRTPRTPTSARTASSSTLPPPSPPTSRSGASFTMAESPQPKTARTSRSSSASTASTLHKRKVERDESPAPRAPKRRRSTLTKEDGTQLLAARLKETEKDLRQREAALKKREAAAAKKQNALVRKEEKLSRDIATYQERFKSLKQKTRDVDAMKKELATRSKSIAAEEKALAKRAECDAAMTSVSASGSPGETVNPAWALAHLEEHFTCSLCYEIMACPYTLSPGRCGHSFCALCVLQWCFAAVHRGCGYWHDSLECPLCRAELPYTSDHTPRSHFSFPFTPNRLADGAIKALVDVLKEPAPCPDGSGAARGGGPSCDGDKLASWRENGMLFLDWEMRDKRGRTEMTFLATEWSTLQADDFIAFKDRLAV